MSIIMIWNTVHVAGDIQSSLAIERRYALQNARVDICVEVKFLDIPLMYTTKIYIAAACGFSIDITGLHIIPRTFTLCQLFGL